MRNLQATSYVSLPPSACLAGASCACLDSLSGGVWVVSSAGLCRVSRDHQISVEIPLVDGGHVTPDDHVIGVEHLSDLESVCLATHNGDILLYNTHTQNLDCVGSVSGGVVEMVWSPDQELVVLCTGHNSLLLMTPQLDPSSLGLEGGHELVPVIETVLFPDSFGEAKPVTLGWGQKSTQFHGSLGKQSAREAPPPSVSPAHSWDHRRPLVSWRGDGEYFVCSCVDPETGGRRLRVWSREGVLHSTGEETDRLEPSLHWSYHLVYLSNLLPLLCLLILVLCFLLLLILHLPLLLLLPFLRPTGNIIATSQCLPHIHQIIFYERNGLRHGQFPLPHNRQSLQVRELQWNCDSTVLSVWLEGHVTMETSPKDHAPLFSTVQLWCIGNYHWYLKQEIISPLTPDSAHPARLSAVLWDPVTPLKIHILTTDCRYMCSNWRWCVSKSNLLSPDNICDVAVIDGDRLLLTPLRYTITPPPMSTHTLILPSPILLLTHAPPPHSNDFAILTTDGNISIFSYSDNVKSEGVRGEGVKSEGVRGDGVRNGREAVKRKKACFPQKPNLVGTCRFPQTPYPIRQLSWFHSSAMVAVVWNADTLSDSVVEFSVHVEWEERRVRMEESHSTPLPSPSSILTLTPHHLTGALIAQLADGTILKYSSKEGLLAWQLTSGAGLKFPEDKPCDDVAIAVSNDEECVVGLNLFHRSLYINDQKVASGVTTFDLHNEFLIYSTDSHTCRFIPLTFKPKDDLVWNADTPHAQDESVRKVERGSKIVAVVPHDFKLVLQMPRGNLETVCPRALVLAAVRRHIDRLHYRDAFLIMRKHRINLNFIYDHNPEMFLSHTKDFVEQLKSVSFINLFLTELKEEDTTVIMYPGQPTSLKPEEERKENEDAKKKEERREEEEEGRKERRSKVDTVCTSLRHTLMELGENKYLLSVITSLVRQSEPDLEAVLVKIKHLNYSQSQETTSEALQSVKTVATPSEAVPLVSIKEAPTAEALQLVTAEEALRFSLLLVDVEQLYTTALGMYDLPLTLMVAEKSQKDPKEYLPFLNGLQKLLPLQYQHYTIDRHLRRYRKALNSISLCGPERFEECLTLIKEQSLYSNAMEIFTDRSSNEYKMVAMSYGEHLIEKKRHKEAGIIFFQSGFLKEALQSYERAGCWEMTFALSAQLGYSSGEHTELARRMASSLRAQNRFSAAALVLLDYAKDVEEAIVVLLEGSQWEEALRVAYLQGRKDMIETHLKPHLIDAHQQHSSLITTLTSTLTRHTARLKVVRETKRKKLEALAEGTYAADERDADLFSDTSSITGQSVATSSASSLATSRASSRMSGKSQKTRRKAEHKKWSLREGSSNEDKALLNAIGEIYNTADSMQEEVSSLLSMLVQYNHTSEAKQLQRQFSNLVTSLKSKSHDVWTPNTTTVPSNQPPTGPHSTVNTIIAAMSSSSHPSSHTHTGTHSHQYPLPTAVEDQFPKPKLRDVKWQLHLFT